MSPRRKPKSKGKNRERIEHLLLENESHSLRVPTAEIEIIERVSRRLRIALAACTFVAEGELGTLAEHLEPAFVRINRTAVINIHRVERFTALPGGQIAVYFESGRRTLVNPSYARRVMAAVGEDTGVPGDVSRRPTA